MDYSQLKALIPNIYELGVCTIYKADMIDKNDRFSYWCVQLYSDGHIFVVTLGPGIPMKYHFIDDFKHKKGYAPTLQLLKQYDIINNNRMINYEILSYRKLKDHPNFDEIRLVGERALVIGDTHIHYQKHMIMDDTIYVYVFIIYDKCFKYAEYLTSDEFRMIERGIHY